MKTTLIIFLFLVTFILKSKEYVGIEKISKATNPSYSTWNNVKCKYCNGTGHIIKTIHNDKTNQVIKISIPCKHCQGKGTIGKSKL
jgi:DnaJ-class molecular chaperone